MRTGPGSSTIRVYRSRDQRSKVLKTSSWIQFIGASNSFTFTQGSLMKKPGRKKEDPVTAETPLTVREKQFIHAYLSFPPLLQLLSSCSSHERLCSKMDFLILIVRLAT